MRYVERPEYVMWNNAKQRALKKGLPFTITEEDVRRAWSADDVCPVLGIRLQRGTEGKRVDTSPTLDRKNNAWGYERDNIAVISSRANQIKSEGTAAEHDRIARWMRAEGLE